MQYRTTSYAEGVFDTYWFEKNLQGDIVAVYNDAGTLLVTYAYDAWGYLLSTKYSNGGASTAAQYNPFRYRGYYRDSETGFYYLNSRYYDPNTGRFVNADGYVSTGQGLRGYNMYSYCNNNPVMYIDGSGNFPAWVLKIAIVVVVAIVTTTAINHGINSYNESKIKKEIKDSYTEEEALKEINEVSDQAKVEFTVKDVTITGAYNITSRYDRQKISMIIKRTGKLEREYDNFSSEWLFHNVMYDLNIMRANADPANLEYTQDARWYVRGVTNLLEVLGWE